MADPPPPRDDAVLPAGEADRICAELAPGLLLLQLAEPLDLLVVLPDREGGSPEGEIKQCYTAPRLINQTKLTSSSGACSSKMWRCCPSALAQTAAIVIFLLTLRIHTYHPVSHRFRINISYNPI